MKCCLVFASLFLLLLLLLISPFALKPSHALKVYVGNFFSDRHKAQIQLVCISNEGSQYVDKRLIKTPVNHGEHVYWSVPVIHTTTKHKCRYAWEDDESKTQHFSPTFLVFNGEWTHGPSVYDPNENDITYIWYFEDGDKTKLYDFQTGLPRYVDIVQRY